MSLNVKLFLFQVMMIDLIIASLPVCAHILMLRPLELDIQDVEEIIKFLTFSEKRLLSLWRPFCLLLDSDIIPDFVGTLERTDHMLLVLCPSGGASYQQDIRTVVCGAKWPPGPFFLPRLTYRPYAGTAIAHPPSSSTSSSSFSKPARSTLHPVIIIVPNRRYICVARPPRQTEAAGSFHSRYGCPPTAPPFTLGLCAWAVKQSRSATCVYCVLCCPRRLCQETPDRLQENTHIERQRDGKRGCSCAPRHMALI